MRVKELIEQLNKMDQNMPVCVAYKNDNPLKHANAIEDVLQISNSKMDENNSVIIVMSS